MTHSQAEKTVTFIRDYTEKNHYGPSYREIQTAVGFRSLTGVRDCLVFLKNRGAIFYEPSVPRSARPVCEPKKKAQDEEKMFRTTFVLSDGGRITFDYSAEGPVSFGGIIEHNSMKNNVTKIKRIVTE